MMSDACSPFIGEEVTGGCLEELQHCRVLPGRGVRYIDDHRGAFQRVCESLAVTLLTPVLSDAATAVREAPPYTAFRDFAGWCGRTFLPPIGRALHYRRIGPTAHTPTGCLCCDTTPDKPASQCDAHSRFLRAASLPICAVLR